MFPQRELIQDTVLVVSFYELEYICFSYKINSLGNLVEGHRHLLTIYIGRLLVSLHEVNYTIKIIHHGLLLIYTSTKGKIHLSAQISSYPISIGT